MYLNPVMETLRNETLQPSEKKANLEKIATEDEAMFRSVLEIAYEYQGRDTTHYIEALKTKDIALIELVSEYSPKQGLVALLNLRAAFCQDRQAFEGLLKKGVDVNTENGKLLCDIATNGSKYDVQYLLDKGALALSDSPILFHAKQNKDKSVYKLIKQQPAFCKKKDPLRKTFKTIGCLAALGVLWVLYAPRGCASKIQYFFQNNHSSHSH